MTKGHVAYPTVFFSKTTRSQTAWQSEPGQPTFCIGSVSAVRVLLMAVLAGIAAAFTDFPRVCTWDEHCKTM